MNHKIPRRWDTILYLPLVKIKIQYKSINNPTPTHPHTRIRLVELVRTPVVISSPILRRRPSVLSHRLADGDLTRPYLRTTRRPTKLRRFGWNVSPPLFHLHYLLPKGRRVLRCEGGRPPRSREPKKSYQGGNPVSKDLGRRVRGVGKGTGVVSFTWTKMGKENFRTRVDQ